MRLLFNCTLAIGLVLIAPLIGLVALAEAMKAGLLWIERRAFFAGDREAHERARYKAHL